MIHEEKEKILDKFDKVMREAIENKKIGSIEVTILRGWIIQGIDKK